MHHRYRPARHDVRGRGPDDRADRRRDHRAGERRGRAPPGACRARRPADAGRAHDLPRRHAKRLPVRPRHRETDRMSYTTYRSLEDKVVLISGGASGIGEEFVRAFAANGAKVAFLDVQEDAAHALTGALADAKHTPLFLRCDVTKTDELKAAIEE